MFNFACQMLGCLKVVVVRKNTKSRWKLHGRKTIVHRAVKSFRRAPVVQKK